MSDTRRLETFGIAPCRVSRPSQDVRPVPEKGSMAWLGVLICLASACVTGFGIYELVMLTKGLRS